MKGFVFVLVLILAGVGILGYCLGWFEFRTQTTDGKTNITLSVDKNKIKADENKVLDKVRGTGDKETEAPRD